MPTKSGALGPVIEMTTVEADLLARESSEVSHLGCCVSARPVLKVVSFIAMVARKWEVGMPCTRSWLAGESKWTVVVCNDLAKESYSWLHLVPY